jgi:hypothetical protein
VEAQENRTIYALSLLEVDSGLLTKKVRRSMQDPGGSLLHALSPSLRRMDQAGMI